MFRNFTVLTLVLLFSFSLFAQELSQLQGPQKISHQKNVNITKQLPTNNAGNVHKVNKPDYLTVALPNTGYYYANYQMVPTGKSLYTRGIYLITAAELAAAGFVNGDVLNEIAWTYYAFPNADVTGELKLYFQNTTATNNYKVSTWQQSVLDSMTLVADNPSFVCSATTSPDQRTSEFTYTGGGLFIAYDLANTSTNTGTTFLVNTVSGMRYKLWEGATTPPTYLGTLSGIRPETLLGRKLLNDAGVLEVYTLGKLPIPFAAPHTIIAAVANIGDDTLYSKSVTLNVTGANTYSETQTIPTMLPGYYYEVSFSAWTPTVAGTNTITVTIPSDANAANNTKTVTQLISANAYSYAYGPFPATPDGGVGFTGATGDFVAKFSSSSATSVNQISVNFDGGGQQYKLGIWDATGTGGIPGTLLWESGINTSAAGVNTILVNPKVNVNGEFYVGVRQIGTTNVGFAFQSEDPIRSNTFYYTSPTGTTDWTDFAATSSPFRFMIEPRLTVANDVGASTIDNPPTYSTMHTSVAPKATIANFGLNNQSTPFNVTMNIYDATNTLVYTASQSLALNAGATQQLTFPATFNPTAQLYTAKCFSTLTSDGDRNNDTATVTFRYYSSFSVSVVALLEGFYSPTPDTMVTDEVTVEVRNATAPYALLGTATDTIKGYNYSGTAWGFTAPMDNVTNYYLVVKHRNSIETWSKAAQIFYAGPSSVYNFTTAQDQAYGSNMVLKGTKYCFYSGDVNQDGSVDIYDLSAVDNDVANFAGGYVATDVNGDQSVDIFDLSIVDNNTSLFVGKVTPGSAPAIRTVKSPLLIKR